MKIKLFLSGFFCFAMTPLMAWIDLSPGSFIFQGEFLYFSASYDETYFVINGSGSGGSGNPTPNGKRINNPVGYNPGFRIEGGYGFCDSIVDIRLRWTHLYAKSCETVSDFRDEQLWPTEVIPNLPNVSQPFSGEAISNIGNMYQKGEILIDERLCDFYCFHFTFRQGVEWSYIRYNERVNYIDITTPASETIQFHGHSKGLGPQLGAIILCDLGDLSDFCLKNLSFRFLTSVSLIAANSKAKLKTVDIFSVENKVTQSCFWRFIPEWVFDFGINYSTCLGPLSIALELGYEITTYIRGTSKLVFEDNSNPGNSFNLYSDFYVHGVYGALGIEF